MRGAAHDASEALLQLPRTCGPAARPVACARANHQMIAGTATQQHTPGHTLLRTAVLHGNSNVLGQHGGSPLRMLTILLLAGPAIALSLYALYTRLSLAWNVVALPLLAAIPALLGGGPMCRRMLGTPGAEAPLDTLHTVLALLQ